MECRNPRAIILPGRRLMLLITLWDWIQLMPTHYISKEYHKRLPDKNTPQCFHLDQHWSYFRLDMYAYMMRLCLSVDRFWPCKDPTHKRFSSEVYPCLMELIHNHYTYNSAKAIWSYVCPSFEVSYQIGLLPNDESITNLYTHLIK